MNDVILEAQDVHKHFGGRRWFGTGRTVRAVDGVTLPLPVQRTVGLVGESGSGKSTLGRLLAGLHRPTAGTVRFRGVALDAMDRRAWQAFRRAVQYVFQDPTSSLNPRKRVRSILEAPLKTLLELPASQRTTRIAELLDLVGLRRDFLTRYPHEFSGGQGQRIVIARALAAEPAVLILDEPTSALDVSIQAQILELLRDLQSRLGLTYLFISHDLAVVEQLADLVAVMYQGEIVEEGSRDTVFQHPEREYTRRLLAAVPVPEIG